MDTFASAEPSLLSLLGYVYTPAALSSLLCSMCLAIYSILEDCGVTSGVLSCAISELFAAVISGGKEPHVTIDYFVIELQVWNGRWKALTLCHLEVVVALSCDQC